MLHQKDGVSMFERQFSKAGQNSMYQGPRTLSLYFYLPQCTDHIKSSLLCTSRFMATEAYSNITQTMKYYGTEDEPGAHFTFNFLFITSLSQQSSARDFKRIIELWYSNLPIGKWSNWVVSSFCSYYIFFPLQV